MTNDIKNYPELRAYLEGSNESDITRENLKRILEKQLTDYSSDYPLRLLDVGSSDGEMSFSLVQWLKEKFVNFRYTAVEPERPAFERLLERIEKAGIDYTETHNLTVEEYLSRVVKNQSGVFDLIIFSQSFYHIPKDEWDWIIADTIRLLKPKGFCVVILDSHQGQAYELKDVIMQGRADTLEFGDLYSAEDMEKFLSEKSINFSEEEFPIYIFIQDNKQKLSEFTRQLAFLYRTFPDKILSTHKEAVSEFLEKCRKGDRYALENTIKTIIFRK